MRDHEHKTHETSLEFCFSRPPGRDIEPVEGYLSRVLGGTPSRPEAQASGFCRRFLQGRRGLGFGAFGQVLGAVEKCQYIEVLGLRSKPGTVQ